MAYILHKNVKKAAENLNVDIIAQNGAEWIKVQNITEKGIVWALVRFRKINSCS